MTTAKAAVIRCFYISVSVWSAGCGRYGDFTLPVLPHAAAAPLVKLNFRPEPVLPRGDWDASDVLNPSVVTYRGLFHNLYSGYDGRTWHTGLATSADGLSWTKRGKVLSPDRTTWEGDYIAANGSALAVEGGLLYWYQAGPRNAPQIGLAKSADGRVWSKQPRPVLAPGPYMSWDERAVADPYVFLKDGWFYLYYLGQNRAGQQQLGLARSRNGVSWQKLRSNPVISIPRPGSGAAGENGLGEPAVWERSGSYWMLLTGRDARENRSLQLLRSGDGVHWTAAGPPLRGQSSWDAKVLCDPTVLGARFWFGGGDLTSPDEGLHGQIGAGEIE